MIDVRNITTPPLTKNTLSSLNCKNSRPLDRQTVLGLNRPGGRTGTVPGIPARDGTGPAAPPPQIQPERRAPAIRNIPALVKPLQKGQKTPINFQNRAGRRLKACFGWNVKDGRCDIDVSAFLVGASGRVPDDGWFVFYGQTRSPDGSVVFYEDPSEKDREVIEVDLDRLNASIQKIVFVLTINEAFEQGLNFSMIQDAYVRLLDEEAGREIFSYRLDEYFQNVTSMTIGEMYLYNGQWKFNPVGSGLHQDLAGQCAVYGVEIC